MERLLQTLSDVTGTSKGDTGYVGVIGGDVTYTGQPALAAMAALRTGTDVSRALVPEAIHPIVAGYSANVLASPYPGERFTTAAVEDALALADWADALVVGPGLVDPEPAAVRQTVSRAGVPVVVDASAVGPAVGGDADLSAAVFTPDSAEEERITDAHGSLEAFSEETGAVVALTGDVDVIVADGERRENDTGTTAMTVAGTGDTMTGIVASLLGQGMDRVDAAELGAWIVGKAGELASTEYGTGIVATDVIDRIPDTIR